MPAPLFLLALVAAYLCGSIPAGYLAGRWKGIDLRRIGSGNIGATNAMRNLGRGVGIAVFAFDVLKGFAPAFFLAPWLIERGATGLGLDAARLALGICAILGHVFPIWLRFKGGKGVATSAGVCAALAPLVVLLCFVLWYVLLKTIRYVSVASMGAAAAFPLVFIAVAGPDAALGARRIVTLLAAVLALLIVVLHRKNIRRILRGEEPRAGEARPERTERKSS